MCRNVNVCASVHSVTKQMRWACGDTTHAFGLAPVARPCRCCRQPHHSDPRPCPRPCRFISSPLSRDFNADWPCLPRPRSRPLRPRPCSASPLVHAAVGPAAYHPAWPLSPPGLATADCTYCLNHHFHPHSLSLSISLSLSLSLSLSHTHSFSLSPSQALSLHLHLSLSLSLSRSLHASCHRALSHSLALILARPISHAYIYIYISIYI